MGIVIDFAKAKKRQMKEVQKILQKEQEKEQFINKIKRNRSKYQEIKSDNPEQYREYKVDKNTTVRIFNNSGGYIIWKFYDVE